MRRTNPIQMRFYELECLSKGGPIVKYEIINENDAPTTPAKKSDVAIEAEAIVKQLGKGKGAKIEPDEGQTIRGLRVALARAAKGAGVKLQPWDAAGFLYVKLLI